MSKLYFPLFVDISKKKIVVIGGGNIATRRVTTLGSFAEEVTVVAPEVSEEIKGYAEEGWVKWLKSSYEPGVIDDADMVLAATDDKDCNVQIVKDCREREIIVNTSHDKNLCDFYFPSIVEKDGLVVGINASGKNHSQVKKMRIQIEEALGE